jgi:prepilin-type N-terminal cleavage/methylation domain-containing protein/prepilin-type processing-associated H-X9-DG protein
MAGPNMSLSAAFTLVELLVVIGIVAILAGLLLPALARSKQNALNVKCIGNLKQIAIAIVLYNNDFQALPYGVLTGFKQWDYLLNSYAGPSPGTNWPQTRSPIFACPAAQVRTADHQLNYSANPNVLKDGDYSSTIKQEIVPRPSEVLVAADAIQFASFGDSHAVFWGVRNADGREISFNDGSVSNRGRLLQQGTDADREYSTVDPAGSNFRFRHLGRINGLFVDSHAASLSKRNINEESVYTNY